MWILIILMSQIKKNRIQQVPSEPGVDCFKNKEGERSYFGKAKHLRNRVRSYFQQGKHQTAKNVSMIKRIQTWNGWWSEMKLKHS